MPVDVAHNARLSACRHCLQVFFHPPDTVNPVYDHEWTCGKNPHRGPDATAASAAGITVTFMPSTTSGLAETSCGVYHGVATTGRPT
jgi:hypothetical protein